MVFYLNFVTYTLKKPYSTDISHSINIRLYILVSN
jgi:hypothetical protein